MLKCLCGLVYVEQNESALSQSSILFLFKIILFDYILKDLT